MRPSRFQICIGSLVALATIVTAAPGHGEAPAKSPAVKLLTSFEDRNPFENGVVVSEHATDGTKALRIDKDWVAWAAPQDWSGYDYLKADIYTDADKPMSLTVEMHDAQTTGYWTRVNLETVVPPEASTLVLPLAQLYVGEKSRPGRPLALNAIRKLVFAIADKPLAPLFIDNIRLERDTEIGKLTFEGLRAFSLGPADGPLMPGFARIDPATTYSKARGYGLNNAHIWRAFNVLQPDPLYQNFICIEGGGVAVDVPNGRYHVMVNLDNPSGFWGEYQHYRNRRILAQGKVVAEDTMNFEALKKKYFRFWDTEDLPQDNTFDKYQRVYFHEHEFDVDVSDGQLKLDFVGANWACSVSAIIIYPAAKAEQGRQFLDYVIARRRFFFDNYFHRILHKPAGVQPPPGDADTKRGYTLFVRDAMEDLYYNDAPRAEEINRPISGFGFAGQYEPLTLAIRPSMDLGKVAIAVSDLTGPGTIAARDIGVGYVSYRLTRVASDGAVYTIAPRLILPLASFDATKQVTRRIWLTIRAPDDAKAGVYKGELTITPEHGQAAKVPIEYRVYAGTLDAVDIPAGPWGHQITIPWDDSEADAIAWNRGIEERALRKLRDYGFTSFSGMPVVRYLGFKNGKPQFDFSEGDRQMELARKCGFTMPVITYTEFPGLNLYFKDEKAMKAAGFNDYSEFIGAVFSAVQAHADQANWLPVYWNIGDEPLGDDLKRAAENAEAYHKAFGKGPPFFTAATSFDSAKADDPHFRFGKALTVADVNLHNEQSVRMLQEAGAGWAFYNGGSRWTYGYYLYKAAKEFNLKFRLSWHWNACAGDPCYALDCREDDYAWCNSSPDGQLIPSVEFERDMRGGLTDYRYLLTLDRLAKEKHDMAAAELVSRRMAAFKLGQRDHDALLPVSDWQEFRQKMAEAIARLR